jgi:hypothetical protein
MFEFYNLVLKEYKTEILYDNDKFPQLVKACCEYGQWASVQLNITPTECSEVIYQFDAFVKHNRMDGVTILEVERPFIIELYKDDQFSVQYTGKIDRLTETPQFGIIPRDYKKAAQKRDPGRLSNQFMGYAIATNSDFTFVDQVGFQKTLPPDKRFIEYQLHYNKFQKEEWKKNTIWWAKQLAFFLETNTWPENRMSCHQFFSCDFIPICDATDEEVRQHLIKTKFVIGDDWDPTSVLVRKEQNEERIKMAEIAGNYGIDLRIL